MSEENIWDKPAVAAAVTALEQAIEAECHQHGTGLANLLIAFMADRREMSTYYHGCRCPNCAEAMVTKISVDVYGAKAETVRVQAPAKAVH
jgi:hypothetical protein